MSGEFEGQRTLSIFGSGEKKEERDGDGDRSREEKYRAVLEEIGSCRRCGLADNRSNPVPGEGSVEARLVFVGEGPGADEDRLGRPFVGRAGRLLDRILAAANLDREKVYITNTVKCRPPGNRQPSNEEEKSCLPFLFEQLRLIRPEIVVCLGATATRALVDKKARITRIRGRWIRKEGLKYMPTFHPAALLRNPGLKKPVWEDFKKITRELGMPIDG